MFVRKVGIRLKPGSLNGFVHLMHSEILPWLREQEGFQELITLAGRDNGEVAILTFWDQELSAQACDAACPEGLQQLEELLDGIPYVKTFEVVGSTVPRIVPSQLSKDRAQAQVVDDPMDQSMDQSDTPPRSALGMQ